MGDFRAVFNPPLESLARPWITHNSPYPPLSQYRWTGDLTRMARLPYFDRELEQGPYPKRYAHRITDEWGFVNPPSDEPPQPIGQEYDIITTGSSYMAEGSTYEHTIAAQLAQITGKKVYNAAWPGGSPVQGILKLLTDPEFYQGHDQVIILGVIQRLLYSWSFDLVQQHLAEDGSVLKVYKVPQPELGLMDYLDWRNQIERWLENTSSVRKFAVTAGRYLPPMALDKGYESPVRISWFTLNNNAPILFYPGDIHSTYHSYEDRNGDQILKIIQRLKKRCENLNNRLIVLFIPDKYELYKDFVEPKQYPEHHPEPEDQIPIRNNAPAVLTQKLHEHGIEAIDLYPVLHKVQVENPETLLFWVDDTHWSDAGVRVAASTVANYLKENPEPGL